jgi:hypothetical protein
MMNNSNRKFIGCLILMLSITGSSVFGQPNVASVESYYKIKQVFLPEERRPEVEYNMQMVPFKNAGGQLPRYDGENFQINVNGQNVKSKSDAGKMVMSFLESIKSPLQIDKEMRLNIEATTSKADARYIDEQISLGKQSTLEKLKREMINVSAASNNMVDELSSELKQQSNVTVNIYRFNQYFDEVLIDNTAISITSRNENEIVSLQGKFYNQVNPTNKKSISLKEAVSKAIAQIRSENRIENLKGSNIGEIVLLPYADGFKYAWKSQVTADGDYQVWIDAESGELLQLLPMFFFSDNGKGLTFNPDPNSPTKEMTFEVDDAIGGLYTLRNSGVLTLTNVGTDGTSGIVTIPDDNSGTANFNVSPINGTTVERTSQSGYNGQFQQVNIYAHLFNERRTYMLLGSQDFGQVDVTFNKVGGNSFCCPPAFHIGNATTSASTLCDPANLGVAVFNAGCDGTVIAHEFGHRLNQLQYGVGGGSMTGCINEGLADFWACTTFNTNVFAGWWGKNCASATQSGWCPRASEALDIFPEHKNLADASNEMHSAGQIVSWAQWSSRQGMNDAFSLGTLSINLNTIKAMTTAGIGVSGGSDKLIHDSYLDLLKQLAPLYKSSRLIHKLLAGYARAGIFLSPKDAIIDIDHSYLNRGNANGPVFTVWTGDDYTFSGNNVMTGGTLPFNTQFLIEVANDPAFTSNLISSGWLVGVSAAAGGTASWAMPVANWNTLKAGTDLYYRVTTQDAGEANIRESWQPGNNFLGVDVPSGRAAINGTGAQDCSCTASASSSSSSKMALIPILPIIALIFYRRRTKKTSYRI